MGRRPDTDDNDVSLFPFLSILACVIGVLTLMISTLALSQMDNETVAQVEEAEQLAEDLELQQAELNALQQTLDQQRLNASDDILARQQELEKLRQQLATIGADLLLAREKQEELNEDPEATDLVPRQPIEELESELASLQEQIAVLAKEIEERNLPPDEAEFRVLPGGSGNGITPYFIECTNNELVVHRREGEFRVRAGRIGGDPELLKLFDEVAGNPDAKIIFLIRDDGVNVFNQARHHASQLGVPNGKLPVLGHGRLDLKMFLERR
ncbi:MAG: hypothetical protein AAF456_13630 [Planctomycetota bacterium]